MEHVFTVTFLNTFQNAVNAGRKGHSRTPSDVEFRELTWRDAKQSMHNELYKLLNTAQPERREVGLI